MEEDGLYREIDFNEIRAPYYLELRMNTSLMDGDEKTALRYLEMMNRFPKAELAKDPL